MRGDDRARGQHTQSTREIVRHNPISPAGVGSTTPEPALPIERMLCRIRRSEDPKPAIYGLICPFFIPPHQVGLANTRCSLMFANFPLIRPSGTQAAIRRSGYNARRYRGYDCDDRCIISPPPAILANHRQTSQFTIAAQSPRYYILLGMWAIGARIDRRLGPSARHPATIGAPRGCG